MYYSDFQVIDEAKGKKVPVNLFYLYFILLDGFS